MDNLEKIIKSYELCEEEYSHLAEKIIDYICENKKPSNNPFSIIIIGQPAAGKTGVMKFSEMEFHNAISLDIDDLRIFHPKYGELERLDSKIFEKVTGRFSSKILIDHLTPYLINHRYNLILHKTRGDEAIINDTINPLRSKGYNIIFRVLAVNNLESKISALDRSLNERKNTKCCKWVDIAYHDMHYDKIVDLAEMLTNQRLIDCIEVYSRGTIIELPKLEYTQVLNPIIYSNESLSYNGFQLFSDFNPSKFKSIRQAIIKVREEGILKTLSDYENRMKKIKKEAIVGDEQAYIKDIENTVQNLQIKTKTKNTD